MADRITLKLDPRSTTGKKVRALRRSGTVPVHLYGPGIASRSLQCQGQELIKVLARAGGNTPVSITVEGEQEEHLAFVREIQWDPIRDNLFHVDFLRTEATQRVSAEVPVALVGESPGARQVRGTVVQQLHSVSVEALPLDMPHEFRIELSSLTEPDSVIRARDVFLPSDVVLLTDPEEIIARVEVAKGEAVEEGVPPHDEAAPGEGSQG